MSVVWLRGLAPRRGHSRSRLGRIGQVVLATVGGAAVLFLLADLLLDLRARPGRVGATQPVLEGQEDRQIESLKYQIGVLLRPRDGGAGIGGDPAARLIEAALLYGLMAELEEKRGNEAAARSARARGVDLLKDAHHPDPTEAYLRRATARLSKQRTRSQ